MQLTVEQQVRVVIRNGVNAHENLLLAETCRAVSPAQRLSRLLLDLDVPLNLMPWSLTYLAIQRPADVTSQGKEMGLLARYISAQ